MQRIRRMGRWLGSLDGPVLAAMLVLAVSAWAFVEIADEVTDTDAQRFDEWALRALRRPDHPSEPIGPAWMVLVASDITALGGLTVLTLVTTAVAIALALERKTHAMLLVLVAAWGGVLLMVLLKIGFARPRPDLVPHLVTVGTPSFPSGHSMMSAAVYMTLGALLARVVVRRLRIFVLVVAALVTALVGLSRVYLGVHYPTDVLAGWSAGLAWATVCWLAARWLQRRGAVESNERRG